MPLRSSTVLMVRSSPSDTTTSAWPSRRNKADEAGKAGSISTRADERIHLGGRRAHEIDLAHHALARADAAGLPLLLDVAPRGSSEALEQQIGRIDGSDGAVEIDEDATLHTRS